MKQKVVSHSANGALPPEDLGLDITAGPILAVESSHANTTTTLLFEREPARISFDVSAMLAGCAAGEALLIVLRKNGPEEPWTRAIIPPNTTRRFLSPRDANFASPRVAVSSHHVSSVRYVCPELLCVLAGWAR